MRIVVTGAAGFVGSHLCEALLAQGHAVCGVDCFTDRYPRAVKEQNLSSLRDRNGFDFAELDLRTDDLVPILEGADAVVNEAAMAGLSWQGLGGYLSCNLLAVHRLVEASRRAGVRRFVQASTSSVYGSEAVGDEGQSTLPVSPYGVTKLAAEHVVRAHVVANDFPAIVLRYFSVYGPRQRPDMAYHLFIEALAAGRPISVFGDGCQTRANTYVDDVVVATTAALDRGRVGEAYNIAGGQVVRLLDAIVMIADCLGVDADVRFFEARPGDQRHTEADISKARAELGYDPTIPPDEGLRRQVAWQTGRRAACAGA